MKYKPQMTVIKSPRLDAQEAGYKAADGTPLSIPELMALLQTKGTMEERERTVIQNLIRKGLYEGIMARKM